MKNYFKKATLLLLVVIMIILVPMEVIAAETSSKMNTWKLQPTKLPDGVTTEEFVKNPDQPDLYTMRNEYKVERYDSKELNYQPYVATVGAAATQAEKDKVSKTINLPNFPGYKKPKDSYTINYQGVVDFATSPSGIKTGNKEYGFKHDALQEFFYPSGKNNITVRHLFQDLNDFSQYGKKPGATDEIITTQEGNVGSLVPLEPLDDIEGFVPETDIKVLISQTSHQVELRYNRARLNVVYNTNDGTPVPTRTLYYGQEIPPLDPKNIPTKVGGEFLGWKPSVDLKDKNGKIFAADSIIKSAVGEPIKDLNANLIMPATGVKFTAVWKDKEKADYTVMFWTEKSDHPENASLEQKYDYVGTHVYSNVKTGMRPNLAQEPINGVEFPDLDESRLEKIYKGDRFNRGRNLFLNKFYFYNKELTDKENADPENPHMTKSVSATGKTVYNIYYDRQVYDLYFTRSTYYANSPGTIHRTFYPTIIRHGQVLGKPGEPYHFKARFNQRLYNWPNDAMEVKGFSPGKNSYGWGPNFATNQWVYRDTPPYRLSANDFLDMPEYERWGGYIKTLDVGNGKTISVPWYEFRFLSFGIEQREDTIPYHMDFWMDGFKPEETIIDYSLYRNKADTAERSYRHKYPVVQGFTPYEDRATSEFYNEDELNDLNDERDDVTPFPDKKVEDNYGIKLTMGYMPFIRTFFDNADEFGDPINGETFNENGYLKFQYYRNKYRLRFNINPKRYMADSEFDDSNQTKVFYEQPLKKLDLDNPNTLNKLKLTGVLYTDSTGTLRVKKPANVSDQMEFKGWALDPAGQKLVWQNNETMPVHNLVLYAKWDEPDYKWKVTFDPNGGTLPDIDEKTITTKQKTIKEGDIGQTKEVTYPIKRENDGDKQVLTVIQRQKLKEPVKPTREGYSFVGWEVIYFKKDASGLYTTDEQDNSYREKYKVPELYTFGNDVVSPIYLKAVWVKNDLEKVTVYHHFLDLRYNLDKTITENPKSRVIENQRAGLYTMTTGSEQSGKWFLALHEELEKSTDQELKNLYNEYNSRLPFNNTYFQHLRVEPKKILKNGEMVDNPNYKNNAFHFFYVPFRTRKYKVNYVDERAKAELAAAADETQKKAIINKYRLLDQEEVVSQCRHYDARNYKPIKGWTLTSAPQQQLFYDVNENTNELLGINGTGSDEITFFYRDTRVIEVPKEQKTPDGYVRVTFKASDGGSFGKDKNGNPIKEINYDVVKGLDSSLIPIPQQINGPTEENNYYITPEENSKFIKWDNKPLSELGTVVDNTSEGYYVFTAEFEWDPVVEQTNKNKKPNVSSSHVKVIVKTTDKATAETSFEKIFWVDPAKAVKIPVQNPVGRSDEEMEIPGIGNRKFSYAFKNWQKVKIGENDDNLQDVSPVESVDIESHRYTDKVTVVEAFYKKQIDATPLIPVPSGILNKLNLYIPSIIIAMVVILATLIFNLQRKTRKKRNSR